ncbi:hypothetical protein N7G274_005107 [Stereocaulon virgatum]|uniref:Glycosyl hydrolase n=1 Tax=Stereocaulon virgatum TaxID=373712 RepID=A0ABR4A8W5_9LECA
MIARSLMGRGASARVLFICSISLLIIGPFALAKHDREVHSLHGDTTAQQPLQRDTRRLTGADTLHQPVYPAKEDAIRQKHPLQSIHAYPITYTALLDALEAMESHFFDISIGTWPRAIDWTAAVMGTQTSATLASMTEYLKSLQQGSSPPSPEESREHENLINRYFTQITSFYFGENAFSLRTQAYDDMLWVVLGWLEAIKFIDLHSSLHYAPDGDDNNNNNNNENNTSQWYGRQFIPQYAHRARIFYNLASAGWDTTLCGGGMIWNPYLAPYKNAITNQLYIAASISMYLHFPGDRNSSPFTPNQGLPPAKAHDVQYLNNAVSAYAWLKTSAMTNAQGLYVDGFHIAGWRSGPNGSNGTRECDLRDETVYTYNQGVILSALRGLWLATSVTQYLIDGHELVQSTIAATGWADRNTERRLQWAGLGRGGVMEEQCDWSGTCSQNGQAFKGIFWHHLTLFCEPLPGGHDDGALHKVSCEGYREWVRWNAAAAAVTRDEEGVFGEWWGRPARRTDGEEDRTAGIPPPVSVGSDYRNNGVPDDEIWRLPQSDATYRPRQRWQDDPVRNSLMEITTAKDPKQQDINDRGRGRTVETQSGGVAVLRALWKSLVESREQDDDDNDDDDDGITTCLEREDFVFVRVGDF